MSNEEVPKLPPALERQFVRLIRLGFALFLVPVCHFGTSMESYRSVKEYSSLFQRVPISVVALQCSLIVANGLGIVFGFLFLVNLPDVGKFANKKSYLNEFDRRLMRILPGYSISTATWATFSGLQASFVPRRFSAFSEGWLLVLNWTLTLLMLTLHLWGIFRIFQSRQVFRNPPEDWVFPKGSCSGAQSAPEIPEYHLTVLEPPPPYHREFDVTTPSEKSMEEKKGSFESTRSEIFQD